jgi:two-component system LytT family response regulator
MIKAIIVDDEPLARKRIRNFLEEDEDISIERECSNGLEACSAVRELSPDLLFLDVQMPELDGFGVLQALDAETMPVIIFVTAFDRYAVEAFSARALDFLLKPFNRARFEQAVARAKQVIDNKTERTKAASGLLDLINEVTRQRAYPDRLVVKSGGKHIFLKASEVQWIEAERDYARLHLAKRSYLVREKFYSIEQKLDPKRFARIHRSTIVNVYSIEEAEPGVGGEYIVRLADGTNLVVSRKYKSAIQPFLDRAI